ncbi:tetratricopeptide repeat protein, partial [Romboutsia sp.]|uniref:tetratricopeptide repeat protein n=1 Tax=Romboutsia sp. TaxID=1965302 RepID=UPI002CBB3A30
DLIEPYVILSLLYDKLGNVKKREHYLYKLREIDKDNPLFDEKKEDSNLEKDDNSNVNKKINKKNTLPYVVISCLVLIIGTYFIYNKKQIKDLYSQIDKKEEKLDEVGKQLDEKNQKLEQKSQELDEVKKEEKEDKVKVVFFDEETVYTEAIKQKKNRNYEEAIENFKHVIYSGKNKQHIEESTYEVAVLSEKLGNKEEAVRFYKKYIYTYTPNEKYYDDAFYQLGMLYYDNGELENAKNIFYALRNEVPDSMYNNSKIREILKEK